MKNRFTIGDKKRFTHKVGKGDLATFNAGTVHTVCSTFALAKYIEWTSRLFVIDSKKEDEEGIGTALSIKHISPAFENEELLFEATVSSIIKNELLCEVKVSCKGRTIATAQTGQKLLKKEKLNEIFSSLADS